MITKEILRKKIEEAKVKEIKVDNLIFDKSKYSRTAGVDRKAVVDYSKQIVNMPPIIINQNNYIVDGVHRYKALKKAKQEKFKIKQVELGNDDVKLANLLVDLENGVRHKRKDLESIVTDLYEAGDSKHNKQLREELNVSSSTFSDWTKDIRSEHLKEVNEAIAKDLLKPNLTQSEIAKRYNYKHQKASEVKNKILSTIPKLGMSDNEDEEPIDLEEDHLEFLEDYQDFVENDIYLYNIWRKGGDDTEYFGGFPKVYMKNLLYYHTNPLDLVFDPLGGSGTTIFSCQEMYRKYFVTDLNPDKSIEDMKQHDIREGLPKNLPQPDLAFLDPPYWKQAEGQYSDSENDLSNMNLEKFNKTIQSLIKQLEDKRIEKVAIVIQPTQYANDFNFVDHIFDFDEMFTSSYDIEMRYILPYSTEQYNAQMVEKAKEENEALVLHRDLVVWKRE